MADDAIMSGISGLSDASAPAGPSAQPGAATVQSNTSGPQAPSPATPAVSANTPHAGLMSMISGMMLGLDAFGKSIATQGREGGVREVLADEAAKEEMGLKRRQDARAQEDHATRMKLANSNLLMATAQLHHNLQMFPLQEKEAALDLNNKATAAYNEALSAGYDFQDPVQAAAWGRLQSRVLRVSFGANQSPDEVMAGVKATAEKNGGSLVDYVPLVHYNDEKHGTGGEIMLLPGDGLQQANATPRQIAAVLPEAKSMLMQAKAAFGDDNPDVQRFAGRIQAFDKVLQSGGKINAYDLQQFRTLSLASMSTMIGGKGKADKIAQENAAAQKAKNDADPLFKLENDPGQMSGEKASAAIPMLQNKMTDPATAPADKVRASRLLAVAQAAHNAYFNDLAVKAKVEQAAKQGDYKAAGQMLADGLETQAGLKMRGTTTDFILKAVQYARTINPKYNPADEMIAEHQAKSETNVNFFGSANSLIQKGGTLDQLIAAGSALPNHQLPSYNKLSDFLSASAGRAQLPAYEATALAVADDYAKVMGGGQGSDSSRMQVYNSIAASLNQGSRVQVAEAMRKGVGSQIESRIGTNQFMNRIFGYALPQNQPKAAPAPAGATMKVPGSDGKMHWSDGKQDLGIVQ